jgi:siroheme synthase
MSRTPLQPGTVAFVGAGPGDPDLLTVKALRALQQADVVIHDRLVARDILDLANPAAHLLNAGKEGFGPSMSQAASASVAAIGQSLTKRGRNAAVRFLTGHDMKGFADHDWRTLARPGEVAAIYMGKKSARFIQGRLIMHGADRTTPVTVIENASRPEQRVLSTTLERLPADLAEANLTGPALTFLGLAPRAAEAVLVQSKQELA